MAATPDRVSERLAELKSRSGRSYEWLARRAHTSKSSVQRYCSGNGFPTAFGIVESIALACGASPDEVTQLFVLWDRERTAGNPAGDEPAQDLPAAESRVGTGTGAVGGRSRRGRPRLWPGLPLTAGVAVLASIALTTPLADRWSSSDRRAAPSAAKGPSVTAVAEGTWTRAPAGVTTSFFGVTVNSATGAVPGFRIGALRLWDSSTRWAQLEPARGRFDWTVLDRHVDGARHAGLPVLFTFGGTPRWANPGGAGSAYPDGGRASAPSDLTDWTDVVRAVGSRYAGRIEAYELWPLGNDRRFFDGGIPTLVDMTRRAARVLREVDPKAKVVCPGMGNLWTLEGRSLLRRFAEAGGFDACDAASIKLYPENLNDPPEQMIELAATVDRLLHQAGVQPAIWVTGTRYDISQQPRLDPLLTRAYATRYFLAGLYARPYYVDRMYFYNWGGSRIPLILQPEGSPPTAAARAVARLQDWLVGTSLVSCGHGAAAGLPANAWQCRFLRARSAAAAAGTVTVRWTETGTAEVVSGHHDLTVTDLDGRTTAVRPGDRVILTAEPVLVDQTG